MLGREEAIRKSLLFYTKLFGLWPLVHRATVRT